MKTFQNPQILAMMIIVTFCTAIPDAAHAGDKVVILKSTAKTSRDIPLKFKLEKTTWDGDDIQIWGTVTNPSTKGYDSVRIIFTVKGRRGEFIGRQSWFVEPDKIGPRQSSYVEEKFVSCEGRKPSKIEYSIIGDED